MRQNVQKRTFKPSSYSYRYIRDRKNLPCQIIKFPVTEPGLISQDGSQSKSNDATQATKHIPMCPFRHLVASVQNKQPLLKLDFDRCRSKPPMHAVILSLCGDTTTIYSHSRTCKKGTGAGAVNEGKEALKNGQEPS